MHDKRTGGVSFSDGFKVSTADILKTEEAILGIIKKELPEEAQRTDVIQYILDDIIERTKILKIML